MAFKADVKITYGAIKIYINDVLHLVIKQSEFICCQSWIDGDGEKAEKYCIEFYTKKHDIITEYDDYNKWLAVLKSLDEENLFIERFN